MYGGDAVMLWFILIQLKLVGKPTLAEFQLLVTEFITDMLSLLVTWPVKGQTLLIHKSPLNLCIGMCSHTGSTQLRDQSRVAN